MNLYVVHLTTIYCGENDIKLFHTIGEAEENFKAQRADLLDNVGEDGEILDDSLHLFCIDDRDTGWMARLEMKSITVETQNT